MDRAGAAGRRGGGAAVVTLGEPFAALEDRATPSTFGQGDSVASLPRCPATPLPRWHLWIDEARPGWANMAIDEALLERAEHWGESWLRLYQWKPHCLSFGRHEPATRRYDADRIARLGLDTVRRPTGGRAVWHARELTYAVAAPCGRFGPLRAACVEIHRMLGDALELLGAPVSFAPAVRVSPLDAGACFSQAVGGEIMVAGRKVVGSAQLRQGSGLLQHGSVRLEDDQGSVHQVTRGALDSHPAARPRDLLGHPVPCDDMADAIAESAAYRWQGLWERVSQPDVVLSAASRRLLRYRSAAWTWAR